jgi:hypothetical protein
MDKEIKAKLEELVDLMNNPEVTVTTAEVKKRLEYVFTLVNDPEETELERQALRVKRDEVVALVHNASVDPDIEIEYCEEDESGSPYILVTYVVSEYTKPTRTIHLKDTDLRRTTAEGLANQITFSIEEFKGGIESVEMG